jgi:predicted transposase/invertase (TIGR01784 family)
MALGIDPKVDIAFKKVFGEENAPLLLDLLNAVVQPTKPITGLEIVQAHADKDTPRDKGVVADLRARDQGNRQFHVEMQRQVPWYFPKRLLFYWARFHPQQLREGEHYQTLRPTISISFASQSLFADLPEHHLVFRLQEVQHGLVFSNDLEIHFIELPKFTKTAEDLSSNLDRWCYFLRHGAELDPGQLPPTMDVPPIRRAMEVLTVFTQDERERAAYEERLMIQLDRNSLEYELQSLTADKERLTADKEQLTADKEQLTADKERLTTDKERLAADKERLTADKERLTADKERAVVMAQIHTYQEVLKRPLTPEAELVVLPQEDLAALLAQLRKQLLSGGG